MSEWKPIETHPRDGTEFLAYSSEVLEGVYHVCFAWDDRLVVWADEEGVKQFRDATHWRELPEPPDYDRRLTERQVYDATR